MGHGEGKSSTSDSYRAEEDRPDVLPGTPARLRLEPSDVSSSPHRELQRSDTAPVGYARASLSMGGDQDQPNPTLPRSISVATVSKGRDPTWPEWLASAKDRYPALLPAELRSLREMFERHAVLGRGGERSITLTGVGEILNEGFRHLFNQLDADNSGSLERGEIEALVGSLGEQLSTAELNTMMKELDADGSGDVSYEEFRNWWDTQQFNSASEREKELQDLFDIVDADSSGEVDWEEFLTMIGTQLARDAKFSSPKGRPEPFEAGMLVLTALECVRADVRAIYGRNSRGMTGLRMLNQAEMDARRRRCFFTPDSMFRKAWDLTQALMLFYVALAVPLRIGFDITAKLHSFMFYFELLVDCYFYIDIFINFRSAHRNVEKELVVDLTEIRRHYLRTWFPIDVLSCLPVNYIELAIRTGRGEEDVGSDQNFKLFKVLRLLRLAKLLRLARINRLLQRLEQEYDGLAAALKVQKIMLSIIFVAHMVACFWYYVGTETRVMVGTTTAASHPDEEEGVQLFEVFGGGDSISNPGGILEGWVVKNGWNEDPNFERVSLWTRYLDAFYFSVTTLTTVGFGDRTPFTNAEKVFSILAELAGSIIFGIIAGSMGALAMSTKMSEREMKFERERLDEFLKLKRINKDLRRKVSEQMDNWFETKSVFDEQAILDKLPPKHRKELLMAMYRDHLATCPLLKNMEEAILTKLCLKMCPYLALQDDLIVKEGDVGEEMYMVVRGCVRLSSESFRLYNDRNWEEGAFFGEMPVLGIGTGPEANRHVYSVTAFVTSDCIFISQRVLSELQVCHPEFKRKMRSMAIKRAQRFGYGHSLGIVANGSDAEDSGAPAVDVVAHLDSSMNVALDSAERRARGTSFVVKSAGRSSNQRESRKLLNLPSSQAAGDDSPHEVDLTASSQLKQELHTEISASSQAGPRSSGVASTSLGVHEEVKMLRQEVSTLSGLLRQSLICQLGEQTGQLLPPSSTDLPARSSSQQAQSQP